MQSSFVTTVVTPRKCAGPARPALETLGDAEHLDRCREALRVDLLGRRREQEVGAGRCGQLAVALLVARDSGRGRCAR